ncbi:protein PML isoform X2 [Moschus berezovskii]|uniref:protein PML isoform X2 n=1 Tax=Moschus berezovskii TaxID=68408 RepID=UPI002444B038|nr:protein PML isoform X2 [Moschus berezovskii]
MLQDPEPAGSPEPQQDPALPHSPSMPPPESLCEGHQSSHSDSPTEQATEEEFQFLRCQGCRAEAKCPKLLPCLHTLCSGCLEESGTQCPVCRAPWPSGAGTQALDNVFFESLQRRLSVYQQIAREQAFCTRCKEPAHYWCFECEQLICAKCFEAHQWFLKHEARPLAELRSQSVREFLDGTRKSNNIFCSNPNHRSPMLTSIYCRGCSKPLCCSCALLDRGHSELKCDISTEIQQRQDELDTMTKDLQEQDRAFGAAQAQMRSAISQLGRVRADTEELIRERVREVVAHVLDQERELLEGVGARYQRDYEEIAGQLGRLDAVLQRIRMGSVLVQRMKLYASDQEVLDMHDFLRKALHQLRQEEPQSLRATVHTDSFNEFRVRLQDLVSCITQGTDAALSRRASPEAASTPRDTCGTDPPEEVQRDQVQATGLAVVQPVPGAHPVPVYAFSIQDPSCKEEVTNTATPQKRKACQTECPRKVIKMESEEGEESRLARSSPEQPRPSTSRAVSPPHLDGPPSPKSPIIRDELSLPDSNHQTGDPPETEERVVVISSSEDSDAENLCAEPTETAVLPPSSSVHPPPRARRASHPLRASRLSHGTCRPPAWPPHHPAEQAAVPDAESPSQPAGHQEQAAVHRGISFLSRGAHRALRPRSTFHLPLKTYGAHTWTWPPSTSQATTPATTGPPSQPANPQEDPTLPQRAGGQPRLMRLAARPLDPFPSVSQWLNIFPLPHSPGISQRNTFYRRIMGGGRASQIPGAEVSPGDSGRVPMENPPIQVPPEASPSAFLPPHPLERPPTGPDTPQTSL